MRASMSILFLCIIIPSLFNISYVHTSQHSQVHVNLKEMLEKIYGCVDKTPTVLLSNKKMRTLPFEEVALVYLAAKNTDNLRCAIDSLERMYATCSEAKIAEEILWELANSYVLNKNYPMGAVAFEQFRQLFPGSVHFWDGRLKEIETAYCLCLGPSYDKNPAEYVVRLCREYAADTYNYKNERYQSVLSYLQKAYALLIFKEFEIIDHYLIKYVYTWDYGCILSSLLRLETLTGILEDASTYEYDKKFITRECLDFITKVESVRREIGIIFENHPCEIPHGKKYHEILPGTMQYICAHAKALKEDISWLSCSARKQLEVFC